MLLKWGDFWQGNEKNRKMNELTQEVCELSILASTYQKGDIAKMWI